MRSITRIIILLLISLSFIKCNIIKTKEINRKNSNVIFILNSKPKLHNKYIFEFYHNSIYNVKLYHQKHKNFDNQYIDLKMLNFKINKSFLRKNRDIILTKEKIKKMGREKFISLLSKKDMIFLIDKNMTENNKITIMEVNFVYNAEE